MNKIAIYLTKIELSYLEHIMYNFTDYMAFDDRPDHGFGILKDYRQMNIDDKHIIYTLAGKLRRRYRNLKQNSKYA